MKNSLSHNRHIILLAFTLLILIGAGIDRFVLQRDLPSNQPLPAEQTPLAAIADAATPVATLPTDVPITEAAALSATVTPRIEPVSPISTPIAASAAEPISPISSPTSAPIPVFTYQIVNTYAHDPAAFTQGLIYHEGLLYEGTGLNGRSSLRKVELESGTVLEKVDLTPEYFGEGITLFADRIIQLSWQNQRGFIWAIGNGFTLVKDYNYPTEGWGITHNGTQLIMSDGSDNLYFWDAAILTDTATQAHEIKRLAVSAKGEPIVRLNELEYVEGQIFANIWQTDRIARVNPSEGTVVGWIDLANLLSAQERANSDVLNGIAYDDATDRLFVTGKLWPKLFEIELILKQ